MSNTNVKYSGSVVVPVDFITSFKCSTNALYEVLRLGEYCCQSGLLITSTVFVTTSLDGSRYSKGTSIRTVTASMRRKAVGVNTSTSPSGSRTTRTNVAARTVNVSMG